MKKRNYSIIIIIIFTLVMAVTSILIVGSVKKNILAINYDAERMLTAHYISLLLAVGISALIIISQSVDLIEKKPKMYEYDMSFAMMNECSEFIKLQQRKNAMYAAITQSLSNDYESVYFIDTETENYMKYTMHDKFNALKLDKSGRYFFTDIQRYLLRNAYKDDLEKLAEAVSKENMLSMMSENKAFTVKYRSVKGGITSYYILKAVHFIDENCNHIVVGISNIDSSIQNENEYKEAVGEAIQMAIIDDLTGFKNRNAYVKHEHELEEAVKEDKNTKFAVTVLDVNDLKYVNDNYGHKAGDNLLKEAAALIRSVYDKNDIYRIGGDEFTVILTGEAYENRHILIEKFRQQVRSNMGSGKVVIASGLAEYKPEIDPNSESVFNRADTFMYKNKKDLKNSRA